MTDNVDVCGRRRSDGRYRFECWYEDYGDDDWQEVWAYEFDEAADTFLEDQCERDCELTEIEEIHVRRNGEVRKYRGSWELSRTYSTREIES